MPLNTLSPILIAPVSGAFHINATSNFLGKKRMNILYITLSNSMLWMGQEFLSQIVLIPTLLDDQLVMGTKHTYISLQHTYAHYE